MFYQVITGYQLFIAHLLINSSSNDLKEIAPSELF